MDPNETDRLAHAHMHTHPHPHAPATLAAVHKSSAAQTMLPLRPPPFVADTLCMSAVPGEDTGQSALGVGSGAGRVLAHPSVCVVGGGGGVNVWVHVCECGNESASVGVSARVCIAGLLLVLCVCLPLLGRILGSLHGG